MQKKALSTFYCLLSAWLTFVGLKYEIWSEGLASHTENGPFYCRDLLSSGDDADAMVFALSVFCIPMALRLLRFQKPASRLEIALALCCASTASFALFLASLDCAQIFYTAFAIPDVMLASALLSMPLVVIFAALIRKSK